VSIGLVAVAILAIHLQAAGAAPTVEQAMRLAPVQRGVDYDRPPASEIAKCTIKVEKLDKTTSWVVRNSGGQVLRRFADTNADNLVDQWSYFKTGLEVYRDIDANFNGKADRYRWFNTGGSRAGVDTNEDGTIDQWSNISAEEAAAEVVEALKSKDSKRFACLLLTADEIKSLGLAATRAKQVSDKVTAAVGRFSELAKTQKTVSAQTEFIDFVGTRPGSVPAGTDGSTRDLLVYENVIAMVQTGESDDQVVIGTLIQVGPTWRIVDAPAVGADENVAANGLFFQTAPSIAATGSNGQTGGPSEKAQALMVDLEKLDRRIAESPAAAQASLNAERAKLLESLSDESKQPEERAQWLRQLADTVSVAVQAGNYPDGVERLEQLEAKLAKNPADEQLLAYIMFRRMSADYAQKMQAPSADFVKVQSKWLEDLKAFVENHPKSSDTAEALLQLAIAEEFAGQEDDAVKWYSQILADFPKSLPAKKAAGAKTRLQSVGKPITLRGRDLRGRTVDLARYRGKTVLIQYWATWCEPCITDMARIKELVAKYAKQGFTVVGVSLDSQRDDVAKFLQGNRLTWPQIYEPGGLESRLANEMGILTLPTMILIDKQGRVVNRGIHVTELDAELGKLLR
jgi:thiol-disulfide isomerase/thioredoxin